MSLEVLTLAMHFVISLAVLFAYVYTVVIGQPDETLKTLLSIIGGYWFGIGGGMALKKIQGDKKNPPPKGGP